MQLVAVTENGQTKILPLAEPDWQQLWGTGPYWGSHRQEKLAPAKPVSQAVIGTSPETPVYVVSQGGIAIWPSIIAGIGGAVVGALIAQTVAHHLTNVRDERKDLREAEAARRAAHDATVNELVAGIGEAIPLAAVLEVNDTRRGRAEALNELLKHSLPLAGKASTHRADLAFDPEVETAIKSALAALNALIDVAVAGGNVDGEWVAVDLKEELQALLLANGKALSTVGKSRRRDASDSGD